MDHRNADPPLLVSHHTAVGLEKYGVYCKVGGLRAVERILTHSVAVEPVCVRSGAAGSGTAMRGRYQWANVEALYAHVSREGDQRAVTRWLGG